MHGVILGLLLGYIFIGLCYLFVFLTLILPEWVKGRYSLYKFRKNYVEPSPTYGMTESEIKSKEAFLKRE